MSSLWPSPEELEQLDAEDERDALGAGDYLSYLKALVNHFDQAMRAEGVAPDVRDRVVSRVLYGTPEPDGGPSARVGPSVNTGGL